MTWTCIIQSHHTNIGSIGALDELHNKNNTLAGQNSVGLLLQTGAIDAGTHTTSPRLKLIILVIILNYHIAKKIKNINVIWAVIGEAFT